MKELNVLLVSTSFEIWCLQAIIRFFPQKIPFQMQKKSNLTQFTQTMFASTEVSQNICRELRAQSFEPQHASSAHPKAKREASFVRQEHHSALSCEDNSEQITLKITESWNGLEWKGS